MTYPLDWVCIGILLIFYVGTVVGLRWTPNATTVTEYDPPDGVSPALAGYLRDNGRYERAFAAALVSLASKGYLRIRQHGDWFTLERLRKTDSSLPPEESEIIATLFYPPSIHTYKFNVRECDWLSQTYAKFSKTMDGIAKPALMSAHSFVWFSGIVYSAIAFVYLVYGAPVFSESASVVGVVFLSAFIFFGGSAFIAAVRAWPPTLWKIASFFRRDGRPARAIDAADLPPIVLTASSLLGFGFLGALTSLRFALLVTSLFCVNVIFKGLLEAPTNAGRAVLSKLEGFREFLARADSDRLNHENRPGATPETLEKYIAYAVALDAEHSWGEEFTQNLLEMLQFDLAYSRGAGVLKGLPELLPENDGEFGDNILQLNIPKPKKRVKASL
ncbi:MAG: hypothetical protein WAU89_17940 [Candidatus Acidiferrales bacterium]